LRYIERILYFFVWWFVGKPLDFAADLIWGKIPNHAASSQSYWGYIRAIAVGYVISWFALIMLVDWLHVWVGYASIITAVFGININYFLLRMLWSPGSYVGFLKANIIAYALSWVLLVVLVDWYNLWVGYASILITAVCFNLKFFLLKVLWKPAEKSQI
jgi:hypothetical protein